MYSTPARPSALRVRSWRRLRALGARSLHDGVALLPDTEEAAEDFQWLAVEIREGGGEAYVLRAFPLDAAEERLIRACLKAGEKRRGPAGRKAR
jgi:hypothetical protein